MFIGPLGWEPIVNFLIGSGAILALTALIIRGR